MKRVFHATLFVAFAAHATAQGEWSPCGRSDLQVAMVRYEDLMNESKAWRMRMDLTSYGDAGNEVADKGTVTIVRAGDHIRADHMGFITYQDARVCAVADPGEHIVVLSPSRPVLDLATNQRVDLLANTATSLLKRVSPAGTSFKLLFEGQSSPFSHILVEYSAHGYLTHLLLEWKPVVIEPAASVLVARKSTPRVEMTLSMPTVPDRAETHEAENGLEARLRPAADGYVSIGPWAGYRVVDTRYRP